MKKENRGFFIFFIIVYYLLGRKVLDYLVNRASYDFMNPLGTVIILIGFFIVLLISVLLSDVTVKQLTKGKYDRVFFVFFIVIYYLLGLQVLAYLTRSFALSPETSLITLLGFFILFIISLILADFTLKKAKGSRG